MFVKLNLNISYIPGLRKEKTRIILLTKHIIILIFTIKGFNEVENTIMLHRRTERGAKVPRPPRGIFVKDLTKKNYFFSIFAPIPVDLN